MTPTVPRSKNRPELMKKQDKLFVFYLMSVIMAAAVIGAVLFLVQYHPAPSTPPTQITFEQKMAHLQTGTPLPGQNAPLVIPRWIMVLIFGFLIIQILPLVLAAYKARSAELAEQDLRLIVFLTETPIYLGLLGSLLGVSMTQFISGTLAAPLAYLTTITGILLYLFGRLTILVPLPVSNDLN